MAPALIDPLVDLQIVGAVAPDPGALLQGADPGSIERTAMVGQANFQNARYDQAYAWFNQFARLLGEEVDSARVPDFVLWFRGLSAAHLNDFPAALRDFRALHARDPGRERTMLSVDPVDVTYVLAWLEQHTGSLDSAAALYQEAQRFLQRQRVPGKGLQQRPQIVRGLIGGEQASHEAETLGFLQSGEAQADEPRLAHPLRLRHQRPVRARHFGPGHQHDRDRRLQRQWQQIIEQVERG